MSMLSSGSVRGKIEFDGQIYDLLSYPLTQDLADRIHSARREHGCNFKTTTWGQEGLGWRCDGQRLWLTAIWCNHDKEPQNLVRKIFGKEEVLAVWLDGDISLKKGSESTREADGKRYVEMETIVLGFSRGTLQTSRLETINYTIPMFGRALKNYIEEVDER